MLAYLFFARGAFIRQELIADVLPTFDEHFCVASKCRSARSQQSPICRPHSKVHRIKEPARGWLCAFR
jgi:hypothetical protein